MRGACFGLGPAGRATQLRTYSVVCRLYRFVCAVCLLAVSCCAELAIGDSPTLPQGSGPVPRLAGNIKVGALVRAEHASLYRALFPPEVLNLVANGDLTLEAAVVELPHPMPASGSSVRLLANGELESVPSQVRDPFFSLNQKEMETLSHTERGYRLLWNSAAVPWSRKAFSETIQAWLFLGKNSEGQRIDVELARVYPVALGQGGQGAKTLFRERLRFRSPTSLAGLAWLSIRLPGVSDDYVWAAFPLAQLVSQLSGNVRSEEIFPAGFSANDLHVWSGKVESVVPQRTERLVMLAPVLGDMPTLQAQGDCQSLKLSPGQVPVALNAESRRFPSQPAWVPSNIRFVPRWVWRLDLLSKDPYDLDAIQSLYIDEETSLPIYRASWAADGKLRKVALGVIGFLRHENNTIPWLLGELVHNPPAASFMAMRAKTVRFCLAPAAGLTVEDFDPATLAAAQ